MTFDAAFLQAPTLVTNLCLQSMDEKIQTAVGAFSSAADAILAYVDEKAQTTAGSLQQFATLLT